ncbi:hypothetical protein [Pengzhenrongella sp.]|uniref:hypothetical protein n=1 Tax=Pengzhenrongella sp. TaxID=2888820 RepID=UPI002F94B701
MDGALAEYAAADGRYVVKVPAGVDPVDAAPLTCAGVTSYKAVKVAHVVPGERVAGLPRDGSFEIPIFATVLGGLSVIGSIVGTRQDLREVFALPAAGRTRVITETRKLESINTSMADVLAGAVPARIVFEL